MLKQIDIDICITGMGLITAAGIGVSDFTNALKAGRSGISKVIYEDPQIDITIGALLGEKFKANAILEKYLTQDKELLGKATRLATKATLSEQASIVAATEAWCDAELNKNTVDKGNISVVIGGSNLTKQVSYNLYNDFYEEPLYLSPTYAMGFMDTNQVGIISELLGIFGEGFTIGGASASGNIAIIKAMQLLQLGISDVCIVIGALADLTPMEIQGFMNVGALAGKIFAHDPEKACRPFDIRHEGFVYGQGCGCIILETEKSAISRGKQPIANLLGGGIVLDGNRLTNPSKQGEIQAMKKTIKSAGIKQDDIGYINTHGSSSTLGDLIELQSIKEVFGSHLSHIWLNSTKSITGHCLYSAGVIEAIATVLQMNGNFLHTNLNLELPVIPDMPLLSKRLDNAKINVSLSNSFGFSGINTCIAIGRRS